MSHTFRKAITSEAKPLVGLYSESGCGKTKSALLIAKGFTGDMSKVGMIETESGRGEAYAADAEVGGYNVLSIREDFSPRSYGAAITAAEKAGLQCLIVDSASHEWESATGVLGMAAANEEAGKKGMLVWQRPKMDHQREFMLRLTQTPIPLVIVCMRARYPMEQIRGSKDMRRSETLSPKQSDDILFEMFVHGWIDHQHCFHGTKYTLDVLKQVFIDGKPVTTATGERLAMWASGRSEKRATEAPGKPTGNLNHLPDSGKMVDYQSGKESALQQSSEAARPEASKDEPSTAPHVSSSIGSTTRDQAEHAGAADPGDKPTEFIKSSEWAELQSMMADAGIPDDLLLKKMNVTSPRDIPVSSYARAVAWINAHAAKAAK